MGKVNKNQKPETKLEPIEENPFAETSEESAQPEVIEPEASDEPEKADKEVKEEKPMTEKEKAIDKKYKDSELVDKKEYVIVLLKALPPLKVGAEKTVSGNVARVLIKKGIARLK